MPYSPISPGSITLSICLFEYMAVWGVQKLRVKAAGDATAAASAITRTEAWKDLTATLENILVRDQEPTSELFLLTYSNNSFIYNKQQPPHHTEKPPLPVTAVGMMDVRVYRKSLLAEIIKIVSQILRRGFVNVQHRRPAR